MPDFQSHFFLPTFIYWGDLGNQITTAAHWYRWQSSIKDLSSLPGELCAFLLLPLYCCLQLWIWFLFCGCDLIATLHSSLCSTLCRFLAKESLLGSKRKPSLGEKLPTYIFLAVNNRFVGPQSASHHLSQGGMTQNEEQSCTFVSSLLLARCTWS